MPSKNEVRVLQEQITNEVNADAKVIGTQLFADDSPDLKRMTEDQLRSYYRQKFLDQDRAWLQGEARRDPRQFIRIARQIGVVLPQELPERQPPVATLPQGASGVSPEITPEAPQIAPGPPPPVDPQLALQALQGALAGPVAAPAQVAAQPPVAPMVGPQPVLPQQPGPI